MPEARNIVIVGAGCTGLGAAYRLRELGRDDFIVLEKNLHAGGLSASFVDPEGFTWDIGGHVLFSHYDYFDAVMDKVMGDGWLNHAREAYIWICERFVPYPLQNNLRHLPPTVLAECITGLIQASRYNGHPPRDFRDWILASFGKGIAQAFLFPYNSKVWACPLENMSHRWVGERVSTVDVDAVIRNILLDTDDRAWGPNHFFRFPKAGGTGAIWRALAGSVLSADTFRPGAEVRRIDAGRHIVTMDSGDSYKYETLLSTLPLPELARMMRDEPLVRLTSQLGFSGTHVVGLGLKGSPPAGLAEKNWIYFPADSCPFYRGTVFSNYSPNNVPNASRHWSLMLEIAESAFVPRNRAAIVQDAVAGAINARLIPDESVILSRWSRFEPYGYPTPTLQRDEILDAVMSRLAPLGILSRGRFGAWKYEVGNQDHSFMQGVEAINRQLLGIPELTWRAPHVVNAGICAERATGSKVS